MRLFFLLIFIAIGACLPAVGQVKESFSDGDFTQNPTWTGDAAFFMVNANRQLQSNGPAVTGTTLHLSTGNELALGTQWEYYVQLALATSSGNYAEVHLTSDIPDLKGALRGYFVRMGGTEDEVSLYRKDGSTATKIIDGLDKTIEASDNKFWVRVTRTVNHLWTLELDVIGTRQNYEVQGTVQDSRYLTSAYTGVLFRYTQANAQRFYFDDYTIKDISVPAVAKIEALNAQTLEITFTKPIRPEEAQRVSNYLLNGTTRPVQAEWQAAKPQVVRLQFNQNFATGSNTLFISQITDANGNEGRDISSTFSYSPRAAPGDIKITEIYADLNPLQDLPAAEFFEIYNRSDKTINLQGWQYSDATAAAGTFPPYLLRPGAYLIVTAAADTTLYKSFGPVVGLSSFPSLNDGGDDVELFDQTGQLIDFVRYTTAWYRDQAKREGGWSLELLNVQTLCAGASQWKGSDHPRGGTPGQPNSQQLTETEAPVLQNAFALAPGRLILQFNEPLDTVRANQLANYSVSPGVTVQRARLSGSSGSEVELLLDTPLQENVRYMVTVSGLRDCAGNTVPSPQVAPVYLASAPAAGDVVINEILFNPRPGGVDFVELVNRSGKYLNLQNWKLANRESNAVANARIISAQPLLLAPGQYLALTANPTTIKAEYPQAQPDRLLAMPSLPSYPDAAGTVVLLAPNDVVMDEAAYNSAQHFKLLRDSEGVSLERILLAGPSSESNFHSAASNVQATPGFLNSQARDPGVAGPGKVTLSPKIITPDGDGVDDVLLLQFNLPQTGFVATIRIFDSAGRLVRQLVGNTLLGTQTQLQWDGLSDGGSKVAMGYYILLIDLFDLSGRRETLKETMVVGGRL